MEIRAVHFAVTVYRSVDQIKTIEVHHLVPNRHEVIDKLLLCVGTGINFRNGSKLRVRTKHEIDGSGSPLDFTRFAVPSFEKELAFWRLLPLSLIHI